MAGRSKATAGLPAGQVRKLAWRIGFSAILSAGFLALLYARLAEVDLSALGAALGQTSAVQWGLAGGFTLLSFGAVGQYDAVLHRHFATALPARQTRRAGICAIAVSQTLGFGLVSGAVVRWRMLPEQSFWQALRLTGAVALSFLLGWVVVTSVVLLALPAAPYRAAALIGLCTVVAVSVTGALWHRTKGKWPNFFTQFQLLMLCALDTLAAALALWVLLPMGEPMGFAAILPAFLLAFGAGLVSGTPGGMGAFEITLLALLPQTPEASLLVAVLAWRLVYYALPAVIGALVALAGPKRAIAQKPQWPSPNPAQSPRAEVGLLHQKEHALTSLTPDCAWLIGRTGHVLCAFFDPILPDQNSAQRAASLRALTQLKGVARAENKLLALYKCTARTAARARKQGFWALRIAQEAWVDPQQYSLHAASRAGLRRKLRRAEAAGVTFHHIALDETLLGHELDEIAAHWAQSHGGERGFSMGRYSRDYVRNQQLFVARKQGKVIAFATFHHCAKEWTLDLIRYAHDTPDGTMHGLIQTAIFAAKSAGLHRLSLAAVPAAAFATFGNPALWLQRRFGTDPSGLARFKSTFAPNWQPLYLLALHPSGLALAALSLARAVHAPAPLRRPTSPVLNQIEHDVAEYEFAPAPIPWHRRANFPFPR